MKIQLAHTYQDIISVENLLAGWQEFIVGKKAKFDVQLFGRDLMDNIVSLHEDLVNRTYRHGGYQSFYITDPKRRHIHKASVRDRLLHHAVYRILYPFFDRTFIADSFSCRNGKGMHRALNHFREFAYVVSRNHTRTCWVLKCDIKQFFASVDHGILLLLLAEYISDSDILGLLKEIVGSFSTANQPPRHAVGVYAPPFQGGVSDAWPENTPLLRKEGHLADHAQGGEAGGVVDHSVGLPLGNLTSQLFANVYLNEFDQWVKHWLKAHYYIRYADDFVFLSGDRGWLMSIIPNVRKTLADYLYLTLHPNKITLKTVASGVDFLGWVHFPDHRIPRTATKRRMFRRIKDHPTDETVQSYIGLLGHVNAAHLREQVLIYQWLYQS